MQVGLAGLAGYRRKLRMSYSTETLLNRLLNGGMIQACWCSADRLIIGNLGIIFDDSAPTSGDMAKWMTPFDSAHQICPSRSWNGVITAVQGASSWNLKKTRNVTSPFLSPQPGTPSLSRDHHWNRRIE